MGKSKYYTPKRIIQKNAKYNVIFGERSNGKTTAVQIHGIEIYYKTGKQMAILRRYADDLIGKRGQRTFGGVEKADDGDKVKNITKGEWTSIYYYGMCWYLCRYEDGKRVTDTKPFCYGFALSGVEHDKSTNYPDITTVLFDEFISRTYYLNDEFIIFQNVLSTIIRDRDDVTIFMLGNTVNKFCPYFKEMGLKHVKEMEPGDIDVYQYGESGLTVAVEFTEPNKEGKASDIYFAFDNPRLKMITGGVWEIDIYPHCPIKYKPKDIKLIYFIEFDGSLLQCEIVKIGRERFTFIHPKTTEMKDPEKDIVYSTEYSTNPKHFRNITRPRSQVEKVIAEFYIQDRVFYSDNEVGEIVRNYLIWCGKEV